MEQQQIIVDFLNSLVALDWQAIHNLLQYRVPVNPKLLHHPSVIVQPVLNGTITQFVVGPLGLLNGALGGNDHIVAVLCTRTNELQGFQLKSDNSEFKDKRLVAYDALQRGKTYRVTDAAGNKWFGAYEGNQIKETAEEGVVLRLPDNHRVIVFYHDVTQIVPYSL